MKLVMRGRRGHRQVLRTADCTTKWLFWNLSRYLLNQCFNCRGLWVDLPVEHYSSRRSRICHGIMASLQQELIMGVWERSPQQGPGVEPLVGSAGKALWGLDPASGRLQLLLPLKPQEVTGIVKSQSSLCLVRKLPETKLAEKMSSSSVSKNTRPVPEGLFVWLRFWNCPKACRPGCQVRL